MNGLCMPAGMARRGSKVHGLLDIAHLDASDEFARALGGDEVAGVGEPSGQAGVSLVELIA